METIVFRYRSKELSSQDIDFIKSLIAEQYILGRTRISQILCESWQWTQPNGNLKEYAARDLLLRLEEKGFINLPPRIRENNNHKKRKFDQIPIFKKQAIYGEINEYSDPVIEVVSKKDRYLFDYLVSHYHYLGLPSLVGEHIRYFAYLEGQIVTCLSWQSASFKVRVRDDFIGWDEKTRHKKLHFIVTNTRYVILPWIKVKCLASKVLSFILKRLSSDWQNFYNHPLYLAETFVDTTRFRGICYRAANWQYVGQTHGSSKRGNLYNYHGHKKAVYLYPLHRNFRRYLTNDQR